MLQRIWVRLSRIVKRDYAVFSEIRFDEAANAEAALIVLAAAFAAALSAAVGSGSFFGTFVVRLLAGILLNWLLWSYITVFILTNFYGADAEFWQVARLLGYANIAMLLALAGIFGCLGSLVASLAWVIVLIAAFFMLREGFELPTERAIITVAIGWLAIFLLSIPLNLVFRL